MWYIILWCVAGFISWIIFERNWIDSVPLDGFDLFIIAPTFICGGYITLVYSFIVTLVVSDLQFPEWFNPCDWATKMIRKTKRRKS